MPITVTERWSGPKITYGTSLRAMREFDVSGVPTASAATVAVVSQVPSAAYNAAHPLSTWMYVDSQDAVPVSPLYWHVTIGYSSNPAGRHIDPSNPLGEPYRYRFEWGNTTEGCDRNSQGKAIQTSAGEAFSTTAPTDVLTGFLVVERNEPFYDAMNAVKFSNAVNNVAVTFGPSNQWRLQQGQACCRRIVSLTPITKVTPFVTVQYTIELRGGYVLDSDGYYDGFKLRILDEGTTGWYNNSTMGPIVVKDNTNSLVRVPSPVLLNGKGKPIFASTDNVGTGGPYFINTGSTFALCTDSPNSLPAGTVSENGGSAFFLKAFPQTMKLLDLSALGLNQ